MKRRHQQSDDKAEVRQTPCGSTIYSNQKHEDTITSSSSSNSSKFKMIMTGLGISIVGAGILFGVKYMFMTREQKPSSTTEGSTTKVMDNTLDVHALGTPPLRQRLLAHTQSRLV